MKIEETFAVPAPVEEVWNFLTDPRKMASCLPSVESVAVLDDRRYEVVVKQKVGFISATFKIQTEVLEKHAPHRIVFSNRGKTIAGANGTLKSTDTITLESTAARTTEVRVVSELTLGGQLAVLGAKLIEAKSKELFAEATAKLKERLGAAPPAASAAEQPSNIWTRLKSFAQALKSFLFRRWMVKPE